MEGQRVRVAASFGARLRGLMGKGREQIGEDALFLCPCSSIHTFGMRFRLDVAFVGADGTVLRSIRALPPRRLAACRGAHGVFERAARDERAWLAEGQRVRLRMDAEGDAT